jgi:hypothetical protein
MNFTADTTDAPYITDGTIIGGDRVKVPASVSQVLSSINELSGQIDVDKMSELAKSFDVSTESTRQNAALVRQVSGQLAALLDDNKDALIRIYQNGNVLASVLGDSTDHINNLGVQLTQLSPAIAPLIASVEQLTTLGPVGWPIVLPLLDRLLPNFKSLIPDAANAVDTEITPDRRTGRYGDWANIDAGSFMDMMLNVFPPDGSMRLSVSVPGK